MLAPVYHGGDLGAARVRFPAAPAEWLDLSTGVNAVPYPVVEVSPQAWARLPEKQSIAALEAAAAEAYGARRDQIVAAPGTQALISWLAHLLPARSVAILGFTYGEHERVWREAGAQVTIADDLAALAQADVAVVVNPNNPDGRLVSPGALLDLSAALALRDGTLVVDEAFIDVLPPQASVASRLPERGAVILRSFGKTYGLAGLRLGFAIGPVDFAVRLRSVLGPWQVSGPAVEIGTRALADRDWLVRTTRRLHAETARLDALLRKAGFTFVGGTPLFRLVECADAARWFQRLGEAGILVRRFPVRPDRLRFGIPHAEKDWARLEAALGDCPL